MIKRILVGLAGKAYTPVAIQRAVTLAQAHDAEVTGVTGERGCEAACPSNQQSNDTCVEAIRVLAHRKWEAAGCPVGDGVDFWLEAEREVYAEQPG